MYFMDDDRSIAETELLLMDYRPMATANRGSSQTNYNTETFTNGLAASQFSGSSTDEDMIDAGETDTAVNIRTHFQDVDREKLYSSSNLVDTLEDLPPGIGQYDDFHTIDWLRDIARDTLRHRQIVKKKHAGFVEWLKGAHDAWSGWMCVLLVGVATGTVAGFVDIGTSWMSDLKEGICRQAFWLNREQCCWSANDTTLDENRCSQVSMMT
ncbi:hypothetical protein CHS0354_010706 [Potamilus streckersoni]|uniref:H(+)/Cl(-) exchange transporter 3 n=1 Tax=Potamilus streckersoni TaxID=2493646 RepID=A0AAE0WBT2_9BIVA|nr:hypothetical protein CHS0354_010706 [Potamilus streckersoni]